MESNEKLDAKATKPRRNRRKASGVKSELLRSAIFQDLAQYPMVPADQVGVFGGFEDEIQSLPADLNLNPFHPKGHRRCSSDTFAALMASVDGPNDNLANVFQEFPSTSSQRGGRDPLFDNMLMPPNESNELLEPVCYPEGGAAPEGSDSDESENQKRKRQQSVDDASNLEKKKGLALVDDKKAKRVLANRLSAQRSRMRKLEFIANLEESIPHLSDAVASLSPQVNYMRNRHAKLAQVNKQLKEQIDARSQSSS